MNNKIIVVQNVHGYLDENGTAWLNAADVARGLGFVQTQNKNGVEYTSIRWERVNGHLAEFGFPPLVGENVAVSFIPENIVYLLAMKASNETAKAFQMKIANEILPTIRKTGTYSVKPKAPTPVADMVADVKATAEIIQSMITGVKSGIAICQAADYVSAYSHFDLSGLKKLLPSAEHETGFMNATQIGEKLGLGTGTTAARKANTLLRDAAFQYKDGRNWRLTDEGSVYGEEMPYTKNGHSGYQIRWSTDIVDVLADTQHTKGEIGHEKVTNLH